MLRSATLGTRDGLTLVRQSWLPDGPVRGAIAMVHGFGEHSGRYTALVQALPAAGFAVHGFDLRGHGRSPGPRGHIRRWSDYRDDVNAFVTAVADEMPGVPLFLFGHSMGGLIALEWLEHGDPLARGRLAGAVLSAPGLMPLEVGKRWQIWASHVLSRTWPSFSMNVPLAPISSDPSMVETTRADSLNHRRASARWATEALAAIERAKAGVATVTLPLLIVHGGADRLVDVAGSRWLVEQVGSTDRELRIYPDQYHEVHNDVARDVLVADLLRWLGDHL